MAHDERLYPDFTNGLFAWHIFRYLWALPYAFGRDVLDVGCGSGYGTALLAGVARSVLGVDYDSEAIKKCKELYGGPRNIRFAAMDATHLALKAAQFGLVTCFEVLEHLPPAEAGAALAGVASVLRQDGLFLASTPNRLVEIPHLRSVGLENVYHINYYNPRELRSALAQHFSQVRLFGQVPRESLGKRLLRRLDYFNLRHRVLPQVTRAWVNRQRAVRQAGTISDLGAFQVRRGLAHQAGVLLAACRK